MVIELSSDEIELVQAVRIGRTLKQIRLELKLTLDQVEALSVERFGHGGRITRPWIASLEHSARIGPSFQKVIKLGILYNKTPNEMAEIFCVWP